MCEHGNTEPVRVLIPADLSHTGYARWKTVNIDSCIAPIVKALSAARIHMRGSCCGHGKGEGDTHLQDGRALIILPKEYADDYYQRRLQILDILKTWPKEAQEK